MVLRPRIHRAARTRASAGDKATPRFHGSGSRARVSSKRRTGDADDQLAAGRSGPPRDLLPPGEETPLHADLSESLAAHGRDALGGRELVKQELARTIQQDAAPSGRPSGLVSPVVGSRGLSMLLQEGQADRVADGVVGRALSSPRPAAPVWLTSEARARFGERLKGHPASGEPLSTSLRSYFEPRLGHDLGAVRIHRE